MNLEYLSAPLPEASPQHRYASLHRAIEKGLDSDATWSDLAKVCVQLGLDDEARKAYENVKSPSERLVLHSLLVRNGVIERDPDLARQGQAAQLVTDRPTSLTEELVEACRYLMVEHMPLIAIVSTLAFPLVIGMGGALTAGSPFFLFPLIALLPSLSVVGLVGAMGRRILLETCQGLDDAPKIPEVQTLVRESLRFLMDAALIAATLFGPAVVLHLLAVPIGAQVAVVLLGILLLPMAMLIRQLRTDWAALHPRMLFAAISKGGTRYVGVALLWGCLALPAIVAGILTSGSRLYLQISLIGPLAIAPLFIAARLLGRFYLQRRRELSAVIGATAPAPAHATAGYVKVAGTGKNRRTLTGTPAAKTRQKAPAPAQPATTAAPATAPTAAPPSAPRQKLSAATHPEAKQPQPSNPPAPARPPAAARPAAPAPAPAEAPKVVGEPIPDLTKLPGVNVVTGSLRNLVGAAAGSKPSRPAQPIPPVKNPNPPRGQRPR